MNKFSKYLPIALLLGFLFIGLTTFFASRPTHKNARVYKIVKQYSPYYIEKTLSGLRIRNKKDTEYKEEPTNAEFFTRYEFLEKDWGQKHLKLTNKTLHITDGNKELKSIELKNQDEVNFVKNYYGVK